MPRKRRTPTGAPAQPVQVAAGGQYGQRTALEQQQQAAGITDQSPTPGQGAPVIPLDPAQVAQDHPAPRGVPLSAPSANPGEPLTAGIDFGPGPGMNPNGLTAQLLQAQPSNNISSFMADAARVAGNPALLALAQDAQGLGQ